MKVKVGKYTYEKSNLPQKKLMTIVDGKKVHFGARNMQHFKDKTGIWKSKDHGDKKRRTSFRSRMSGIRLKDGSRAVDKPSSPAYHALRILW